MTVSDFTKKMFADALKEMVRETPFEKIRISNLCKKCNTDRRTFYYHFKDKNDLVFWMWISIYEYALENSSGRHTIDSLFIIVSELYENRRFFCNVYSDNSQNSLRNELHNFFFALNEQIIISYYNIKRLSIKQIHSISFFCHACNGTTCDWLQGKLECSPIEFASYLYELIPSELKEAYEAV